MSISGLSPQGFVLGGLMSSAAIGVGNYFSNKDKTWRGTAIAFGILGIGALGAPAITASLSKWTGVVLNQRQSLVIFGVTATLKAIAIACSRFLLINKVEGPEEARELYNLQLRPLHIHYTKEPKAFYEMDLRTQSILNKRFAENELSCIPYKEFSSIGTDYTEEETAYLAKELDLSTFSQEDRKKLVLFLFENNLPPIKCKTLEDLTVIPVEDLTSDQIEKFSKTQLNWIHFAIRNLHTYPKVRAAWQDLARAFFKAKLAPPTDAFFLVEDTPTFPASLESIQPEEGYLIKWLYNYYKKNVKDWSLLPLETQQQLNKYFSFKLVLFPHENSFPLEEATIRHLHSEYKAKKSLWHVLPFSVQERLNEQFKALHLKTYASFDVAEREEMEATFELVQGVPFFYEKMSEKQKRMICSRITKVPPEPFKSTWDIMAQEKNQNEFYLALKVMGVFTLSLVALSIYSFVNAKENPFVMP